MKQVKLMKHHTFEYEQVSDAYTLGPQDVRVKTKRVGLCGSDLHFYHGTNPLATYPRIIGHEVCGEVIDVGSQVKNIKVNDRVCINPTRSCGLCYACRIGAPNVCATLSVFGIHEDGGMREYFTINEKQCHAFPSTIDWDDAVLAEPYTIGTNSTRRATIEVGDTVLIQGAGTIGITCLQLAKLRGARVCISDVSDEKCAFALTKGADAVCNVSKENLETFVYEWTHGEGVNRIIDAVGTRETFENSLDYASPMGTIVLLGLSDVPSEIAQMKITKKQLTITASRLQANCFTPVLNLMELNMLDTTNMVTHKVSVDALEQGFEIMDDPKIANMKVIVDFDQ